MTLFVVAASAWGQININSSPNIVGSGARALGMGGAFIGLADDATAASWNPGGLTQLERPELSIVYRWNRGNEQFRSSSHPELNGRFDLHFDDLNYLSVVYPIPRTLAGRNFVISLNYQRKYDFDRELDVAFRDVTGLPFGNIFDLLTRVDFYQEGGLSSLSPAFGFELTDRLSAGVVMNIWDESVLCSNEWKKITQFKTRYRINGTMAQWVWGEIEERYDNFKGTNYTFGVLYKPYDRLGFGAVYHTQLAADVKYTRMFRTRGGTPFFQSTFYQGDRRIEFPSAWGIGGAYRFPDDKLTLSLDVTCWNWDQFVEIDRAARRFSPITGLRKSDSPHKRTYTVRFGAEYVCVDTTRPRQKYLPSLRAGAFYDPEPAGGRPDRFFGLGRGNGDPDDFYGITLGGGLLIMDRVNIDAAYIFRWADNVRKDTFSLFGTHADIKQHQFYLSTVIYL